jgi:hypothetical protein
MSGDRSGKYTRAPGLELIRRKPLSGPKGLSASIYTRGPRGLIGPIAQEAHQQNLRSSPAVIQVSFSHSPDAPILPLLYGTLSFSSYFLLQNRGLSPSSL